MQPKYLTTSTGNPEGYSAGLSLTDFTELWNLDRYSAQNPNCFGWHTDQEDTGATFFHGVFLRTTAGIARYDKYVLMRMACHFILSQIPDQGLPEAFQTLAESYHYELLVSNQIEKAKPICKTYEASQGPRDERPVFHIAED